jgi:hypothetical protein
MKRPLEGDALEAAALLAEMIGRTTLQDDRPAEFVRLLLSASSANEDKSNDADNARMIEETWDAAAKFIEEAGRLAHEDDEGSVKTICSALAAMLRAAKEKAKAMTKR